jgi:hypothetical protein
LPVPVHTQAASLLAQLLLAIVRNRAPVLAHEPRQNHPAA